VEIEGISFEARRRVIETLHQPKLIQNGFVARALQGFGRFITPADIEERYGVAGGHLHHGEHAPDQLLFMRPTIQCAKYATPIAGLFLAGSGSHPGGGITCAPGTLAARAILRG